MSKTYKTRPYEVAYSDPANRRFRMVGITDYCGKQDSREWTWKKLTSCHNSNCCNKPWQRAERSKRRHGWKRELRNVSVEDYYVY